MKFLSSVLVLGLAVLPAGATPIVDGTRDAEYGAPLAVQTVETAFGDNLSELDAGYAVVNGGKLYLMLTGNIEDNFNKLEIFIDSKPGGQSVFDSSGNDNASAMDGLVFDAGFTADYHLIARRGNDGGNDKFDVDFANLGAQSASGYGDIMGGHTGSGMTGTGVNAIGIEVGYNNSNLAGVLAGSAAASQAAATAVSTGLELGIALSDLNFTGGVIRIMVGQNNQGHNYWSNQFLGGLPAPQDKLGSDEMGGFTGEGAIDLTHFAGDQFFSIRAEVPEPASALLLGVTVSGLLSIWRRKRRFTP
ncbi:MAG: PEP-CTERM sorting domain-containing protein [Pirellulales bacterium]